MMGLDRVGAADVDELRSFLAAVDLTLAGLESDNVRLWIERDCQHKIVGTTGYEISEDRRHALIRSVAVWPENRSAGSGSRLAGFALAEAAKEGARTAWLFSRRSGAFWQKLGFEAADRSHLAKALADTHQVQLFTHTGQLGREIAWSKDLVAATCSAELTIPAAQPETLP